MTTVDAALQPVPWGLMPDSASVTGDGRVEIAGCVLSDLARTHGTPLVVYDEGHLRARCREAHSAFGGSVSYAAKVFLCTAMADLVLSENLGIDVSSGGELHAVLGSGYAAAFDRITMHGNNKSVEELEAAPVPSGLRPGDFIATPVTGAYNYAMAAPYNRIGRPAVVFAKDGEARLVLRRETKEDMTVLDVPYGPGPT